MGEAMKPKKYNEGIRPPGETLWLAHSAVFGSPVPNWDDLGLIPKVRWAAVEANALENLLAQIPSAALPPSEDPTHE